MGWYVGAKSEENSFCTSSFNFYIKDYNITCHWVWHSKIKPIFINELFKRKEFNDASGPKNQFSKK